MLRWIEAIAVLSVLASALLLYGVNYNTRRIDIEVQAKERQLERLQTEIAMLRADLAFLSRPTRLEAEARKLGLETTAERKFARPESLSAVTSPDSGTTRR
jgi:cell division protein FtsL